MSARCHTGRGLIAALLAVALGLNSAPQSLRAAPADDLKLAVAHFKGKRYEAAAESFEAYLKAAPANAKDRPTAEFFLGLAKVNLEQYAPARTTLRAYVRAHADHVHIADARYQVAWCSYLLDDLEAATREFVSFLDNHEKHKLSEWALVYLGDSQLQLERADAAAKSFRRSLDDYPRGVMAEDARMGLARAYELQDEFANAVAEYRKVADDPRAARREEARFALAGRLYDLGEHADAAKEYDLFVETFGDSRLAGAARLNAGYAHFENEDFRAARQRFSAAADDESKPGIAHYWAGRCSKRLGDYDAARTSFESAYTVAKETAEAPSILYQWADTEFLRGEYAEASTLFARVSADFPDDPIGDEALHEAGNAALRAGDVDTAIGHVQTFATRYGRDNPLAHRQQVLTGRIELARDRGDDTSNAEKRLAIVVRDAEDAATVDHARYELARARFRLERYDGVVTALEPLLPKVRAAGKDSPYVEAFVLASSAQLERKQYEAADETAERFLALAPTDPSAGRAIANRALAGANLGDREATDARLAELARIPAEADLLLRTRYGVAEVVYDDDEFAWAAAEYAAVWRDGAETPLAPSALSGVGWCAFQLKDFTTAAGHFGTFVNRFADDPTLGPEAHYMHGKALQEDGDFAEAATAFGKCFTKYAPNAPATAGAEKSGSPRFAYLAGLQRARALSQQGDVDEADEAYGSLDAKFPEAANAAARLDEWALLNYENERYAKADALFTRIVDEHGDTETAKHARFHLAESAYLGGREDEAAKAFEALLAVDDVPAILKDHSTAHLIEIAVGRRDWKRVDVLATGFADSFPESTHRPLVAFRAGEAALSRDDTDRAATLLRAFHADYAKTDVADEPWFDRVRVMLAEIALRGDDHAEVESQVAALRAESAESVFLYQADEVLGRSFKRRAPPKFDLARAAFARVVNDEHGQKTETAAKAQYLLAETYIIQTPKDYRAAQREFTRVYVLYAFPEWQERAMFQAARCDEALGNTDAAKKTYTDFLAKYGDSDYAGMARERLRALGG